MISMFNNVHIIAQDELSDGATVWDVRTVEGQELIGIIEKFQGPLDRIDELNTYVFTDTFGRMAEFDSIYEARDYAEQSINPTVVN